MKTKGNKMEIDKIASLQLQPNDILVLNYGGKLSDVMFEHVKSCIEGIAPGHKAIILEEGSTLQVLKPALKWTSDLPTQEGWYWFNDSGSPLYWDGKQWTNLDCYEADYKNETWYGPIEPPECP